jgi:hypothetical protein
MGLWLKRAHEDGVTDFDIIIELAGFGATYALMPRTDNDAVAVADWMELEVMSESDEVDDYEDADEPDDDGEDGEQT